MLFPNPHPNAHSDAAAFRDPIELAAALSGMGPAVRARTRAITRHHATLLRVRIQKIASGRPGPNVVTGRYRASWDVKVTVAGGRVSAAVFTDVPQSRRLESCPLAMATGKFNSRLIVFAVLRYADRSPGAADVGNG